MEFPVTFSNQEEVDAFYAKRVAKDIKRADRDIRAKIEDEFAASNSGAEEYRKRAEEAETALLRRDAKDVLREMGVDETRHDLVLKHADLGDVPDAGDPANRTHAIRRRIKDTHGVVPELFGEESRVQEKGLDTSVRTEDEPITEEALAQMSREERLSNFHRIIDAFR
jgi:hypothetical protein